MVFIISGRQGGGKTTTLTKVVGLLVKEGVDVRGFLAPGEWDNDLRTAFFIEDIQSANQKLLCKNMDEEGFEKHGRFYFDPETIAFGEQLVIKAKPGDLLVIDEIGRFEMKGNVWSNLVQKSIEKSRNPLLITVRDEFVSEVVQHFQFVKPTVFNTDEAINLISEKIILRLKRN